MNRKDLKRRDYLLRKEKCCAFDKQETYELQYLLNKYGYPPKYNRSQN